MQPPIAAAPFETARPPHPVYCHEEFLTKLQSHANQALAKRASLLMRNLAVNSSRLHFKPTHGANHGWRRSRLGGGGGSHFYAWWAPRMAPPLRGAGGFEQAAEGAVFLRDIRHHDDHSPLPADSFESHYLPVSVPEMRRDEYAPAPWTQQQARFSSSRQAVRVLKGHPGTGKTTALLNAADETGASHVLYLTYSRDLANLARDYFDRFCSSRTRFSVLTFDTFVRRLAGSDAAAVPIAEMRAKLRGDLIPFQRHMGPWSNSAAALYDEMHAHLIGAAVPAAAGRFHPSTIPRATDKDYRTRRIRFIGEPAAMAVLDLASRLERSEGSLASRYFPELDLAWRAASRIVNNQGPLPSEFQDVGCICVDECQDLTPLEAFVTVALANVRSSSRMRVLPALFAGDEAQTVRPTDFEWGWMNDLLHSMLGAPSEFKLSSNLRSPRTIALLVNHVWDLYGRLDKRDRPGGKGYAEIEDDSTDQVLYCASPAGEELNALIESLSAREGLAIVTYDEALLSTIPAALRPAILSPRDVKGLDFHSVCLLNAGRQLEKISREESAYAFAQSDIEGLRRRLAIDELRVGISRPSERLILVDVAPPADSVRATLEFLRRGGAAGVAPAVPSALLKELEEEQFSLEERVQRCQTDARQYLGVRPELAWSRANQAVALLGDPDNPNAVTDESLRRTAYETLAEICFCLGNRATHLPPELGRPDLFGEAIRASARAGLRVSSLISDIGRSVRAGDPQERLTAIGAIAQEFAHLGELIPGWLLTEISPRTASWLQELESALPAGNNPLTLARILPPFYRALRLPDAEARTKKLLDKSVRFLVKSKRHMDALEILRSLESRQPELEAECLEAVGEYKEAGDLYRAAGKLGEALSCYRSAPDFESAAELIRDLPGHPAAASYQWLIQLRTVLAGRPENFSKVMTAPEKKVLEELLEQGLGVRRKPKTPRKTAVRKTAARKTASPARRPRGA